MAPQIIRTYAKPVPADAERIEALHALYVRLSGLDVPLTHARRGWWQGWLQRAGAGAEADLVHVLRYLSRAVDKGERNVGCLKLQNLITVPEHWEDELALARRDAKQSAPAPRQTRKVVRTSENSAVECLDTATNEPRPAAGLVASVLANLKKGKR